MTNAEIVAVVVACVVPLLAYSFAQGIQRQKVLKLEKEVERLRQNGHAMRDMINTVTLWGTVVQQALVAHGIVLPDIRFPDPSTLVAQSKE